MILGRNYLESITEFEWDVSPIPSAETCARTQWIDYSGHFPATRRLEPGRFSTAFAEGRRDAEGAQFFPDGSHDP